MRENPDLDQLKRQARELLASYRASSPEAIAEVEAYHRTATRETFALHDAQFVLAATSPYVIARDRGYDEIVDVIDVARRKRGAHGPKGPTEATRRLQRAWQSGSEQAVVAVFDAHPDLADVCPPDGLTLLHRAAGRSALQVMKWLLDHGAEVNRKSQQGWTPLDYAATGHGGDWIFDNAKFEQVAELLLAHARGAARRVRASPSPRGRHHSRLPP
jgi:hypothetical protein